MLSRISAARRAASAAHRQLLSSRPQTATTSSAAAIASHVQFYSTTTPLNSEFLNSYDAHVAERAAMAGGKLGGIAPKPLDATQAAALIDELRSATPGSADGDRLVELLSHRVPPGVDEAAYVKAAYLSAVATGKEEPTLISPLRAVELLGTMQGGYNVGTLVELLSSENDELKKCAAHQLKHTLLVFDAFHDVVELYNGGNDAAKEVLESWAAAEWFTSKPDVPDKITVTVFKVTGETNTDDLSPAQDAWSRPDIPLHALAMLKNARDGIVPEKDGEIGPLGQIDELLQKGHPLAYVGDVVGTGSSRKSATNSVLWFMGEDIPYVPNMKTGGVCILPPSFSTPCDEVIAKFEFKTNVLLDEVRAREDVSPSLSDVVSPVRHVLHWDVMQVLRIPLICPCHHPTLPRDIHWRKRWWVRLVEWRESPPGQYCEPTMTTVGSQDTNTTGPMTRDELKGLACLGFSADLVMQSFCHTAAYSKPVDVVTRHTLPDFNPN